MNRPALHPATDADASPRALAERIRALQAEAQQLARDHVRTLALLMADAEALATEIAAGGPVYHIGAAEFARTFAKDVKSRRAILEQIIGRAG